MTGMLKILDSQTYYVLGHFPELSMFPAVAITDGPLVILICGLFALKVLRSVPTAFRTESFRL